MAKYKAYPEYNGGANSIDPCLPSGWSFQRLKFSISKIESGTSVNSYEYPVREKSIGVLKTSCVSTGEFRKTENKKVIEQDIGRVSCLAKENCIIVSRMNTPDLVGATGIVKENIDNIYLPDRLWQVHFYYAHADFIYYWTLTPDYKNQVRLACSGTSSSMQNLSQEQFRDFVLPIPTYKEQVIIADFLRYEIINIDKLINKQKKLITLLREKRQAVVSHAVTKGLNPDVPMKDSGVEWLGEVPKHWDVIRLKYLTNVFEQGWSPQCEARLVEGNEYGVLKVGCVNSGCFDPLEHKALPENLKPQKQYLVKKNDLLISRANTKGLVGSSAVVEKDYDNLILCDKLYRLRFRSHVNPYLISEFIRAPMVRKQIELSASGASHSMQNIGQDTIKELFVAFPPESETQHLIAFIKNKIRIFNSLIDLSHRQVVLLQERRTALISAAVTGKIDVRDWVAPDSQSVEEPKEATA